MRTWHEFEEQAPELAAFGYERLNNRVAYLATTRRDGSPRVHPVSARIREGRLLVRMYPSSPKARDLPRDGRDAMHSLVTDTSGTGGEFVIAGSASRPFSARDGDRDADFISVVAWRQLATVVGEHLSKGRLISVTGRLQVSFLDNGDGPGQRRREPPGLDGGRGRSNRLPGFATAGEGRRVGWRARQVSQSQICPVRKRRP